MNTTRTHPLTPSRLTRPLLAKAWRDFFAYEDYSATPLWLRFGLTLVFAAAVAVPFTLLGFVMHASGEGAWRNLQGWAFWYGKNLVVSLAISITIFLLYAVLIPWLGQARLRRFSPLQKRVFFSAVPLVGLVVGWPLGLMLAGMEVATWLGLLVTQDDPNRLARVLLLVVLVSGVFNVIFSAKARQTEAERSAAEAQLRLLQGQIEPHFLFNTLANVHSLIDHDPPKAQHMLGAFTDYLRASLGDLRRDSVPLQDELALAHAYLRVQHTRMEERLRFDTHASAQTQGAVLPPLLLQPLVENAVQHGLEPQVNGGMVRINARVEGGQLVLEVVDDGAGLGQARAAGQRGNGMALSNLRQRLQARYGGAACLVLQPAGETGKGTGKGTGNDMGNDMGTGTGSGTRAVLRLPLERAAP
jgi:two-component sensor histidine kinase